MPDSSPASITIGGQLERALLPAFLEAVAADRLRDDFDGKLIEEEDIDPGYPFCGASEDVQDGMFASVETFCRTHGLRYIRRSDACVGVWDAALGLYNGNSAPCRFETNDEGVVVLTLDDIRRLGSLAAIEAHCEAAEFEPGPLLIVDPPLH